jgi:hypothetical protein
VRQGKKKITAEAQRHRGKKKKKKQQLLNGITWIVRLHG